MNSGQSITVKDELASGGFAVVFRATNASHTTFALKRMNHGHASDRLAQVKQEIALMRRAHDASPDLIVRLVEQGADDSAGVVYLLIEFCPLGSLKDRCDRTPGHRFPFALLAPLFTQLATALADLHALDPALSIATSSSRMSSWSTTRTSSSATLAAPPPAPHAPHGAPDRRRRGRHSAQHHARLSRTRAGRSLLGARARPQGRLLGVWLHALSRAPRPPRVWRRRGRPLVALRLRVARHAQPCQSTRARSAKCCSASDPPSAPPCASCSPRSRRSPSGPCRRDTRRNDSDSQSRVQQNNDDHDDDDDDDDDDDSGGAVSAAPSSSVLPLLSPPLFLLHNCQQVSATTYQSDVDARRTRRFDFSTASTCVRSALCRRRRRV
jgi:hypothetical protein